ncbi:MAG: hypothetical protein EBS50_11510 [Sphingomonadaceae bacterium]|nr:hypothetical protein [Sphingomonadaceae bacterium]
MTQINDERTDAMLHLAMAVQPLNDHASLTSRTVQALAKIAKTLHVRYEAECSHQWADTDAYRQKTETLEKKAARLFQELELPPKTATLEFQRDPRGWPLVFTIEGREYRLG